MDMSSLALQAASFFGDKVLKKALDTMIGGAKRKRIDSLLREYKSRSFGVPTSTVCLPDRLADSSLSRSFLLIATDQPSRRTKSSPCFSMEATGRKLMMMQRKSS